MKTLRPITTPLQRNITLLRTDYCRVAYLTPRTNHNRYQQKRHFLSNPFSNESQSITASRILPYSSKTIFDVITDVSSYRHYYPFCKESVVTRTSQPAEADGRQYPEEAKLVVGYRDAASEEFWSRVYCVPNTVVEAVSGNIETTLPPEKIQHHNKRPSVAEDPTRKDDLLSHLLTRWSLRPRREHETEVNLVIEFQFANPIYAALSQAAVPRVAEKMIEAFERRLESVVKEPDRNQT